jgi:hypothetical protein
MRCAPLYPVLGLESEVRSVEGRLSVRSWLETRSDGCQAHKTHVNTERPMIPFTRSLHPNVAPFCVYSWLLPLSQFCRPHYFSQRSTVFFLHSHQTAWDSLRCLSKFATLSRASNISNFSAAIISPLTWSTSEAHGTFGVGSRIVRRARASYTLYV